MLRKTIKNGQCIGTMLFSLVSIALIFVPFCVVDGVFHLTYECMLPSAGELGIPALSKILTTTQMSGFISLFSSSPIPQIESILGLSYYYSIFVFFAIVAVDFVFAFFCLFTQFDFIRKIARILSIIFGITMILVSMLNLVNLIGTVNVWFTTQGGFSISSLSIMLYSSGIFFYLMLYIFSLMLIKKQFCWFERKI